MRITRTETYFILLACLLVFLDWYTGKGVIDGTIDFLSLRIPYALVMLPTKTVVVGNWIRIKKKPNGDQSVEINLDPLAKIDMKETLRQGRKKEHHHKHE